MRGGERRKKTEEVGYNNQNSLTSLLMDIGEVLQLVDEVMYAKTGKRLNNLQRRVITGILNKQKYADIAEIYGCSAGHAKDVGYELLQMLSDIFNKPVDKSNLQSVLERQGSLNFSFGDKSINSHVIGCINFGSDQSNSTSDQSQPETHEFQYTKEKVKIEKLRKFGLSDEQIAEALELPLEVVKQMDLQE